MNVTTLLESVLQIEARDVTISLKLSILDICGGPIYAFGSNVSKLVQFERSNGSSRFFLTSGQLSAHKPIQTVVTYQKSEHV